MKFSTPETRRRYESLPVEGVTLHNHVTRDQEQAVPQSTSPDPGEATISGGSHVLSLRGDPSSFTLQETEEGVNIYRHDGTTGDAQLVTSLPPDDNGYAFEHDQDAGLVHVVRKPNDEEPHRELSDLVTADAILRGPRAKAAPYYSGLKDHRQHLAEHNRIAAALFAGHNSGISEPPRRTHDEDRNVNEALRVRVGGLDNTNDPGVGLRALNELNARQWGGVR